MRTSLVIACVWYETLLCIFRKWWFREIIVIIIKDKIRSNASNLICEVF